MTPKKPESLIVRVHGDDYMVMQNHNKLHFTRAVFSQFTGYVVFMPTNRITLITTHDYRPLPENVAAIRKLIEVNLSIPVPAPINRPCPSAN